MSLNVKGAAAPTSYTKYQAFSGYLILVVPHDGNVVSKFPRDDGSPKYQTYSTIIPLEDGSTRLDNGTKVEWKAGDIHQSFIDGAKIRRQLLDMDTPVLGRLGKGKPGPKGGRPWELSTPTEEDFTVLNDFDDLEKKVADAIGSAQERKTRIADAVATVEEVEEEDNEVVERPF